MAEKNKVLIKIDADIRELQSSLKNVESSLKGLEKSTGSFDSIGNSLKGLGGIVASAFAVDKIKDFTSEAVQSASDLNSLNAQYEQVLGGMKSSADNYLTSIAERYNQHPNELKKSFTMYNAMLKGKGVSEKEAYDLATLYMERTADASAFGNMSMAQSTEYFMAMIKGEYDSLDNAMVFTSQTMMNDEAQKKYGKKWEDLSVTQQEYLKTSVAIKQHMDSGVLGQGEREAQEFGVVSERLKATWDDLLATFGTPIMEALAPKLQAMADAIDTEKVKELATAFGEAVVKISELVPKLVDLAVQFAPLISGILATVTTMKAMEVGSKAMDKVKGKTTALKTAFGLLKTNTNGLKGAFTILTTALKLPIFNPVALGVGLAVTVGMLLIKNWDKVKEVAMNLWNAIKDAFGKIGEFISTVWGAMIESTIAFWSTVGTLVSTGISNVVNFFKTGWDKAVTIVTTVFDTIGNAIQVAIMFIAEIVRAGFMLVTLPIQFIWVNCKDFIIGVWEAIKSGISTAINFVVNVVKTYLTMLFEFWSTVWEGIKTVVSIVWNAISSVISTILNIIWNVISTVWNAISNTISTILNIIWNVVSTIWNAISSVVSNVLNVIFTIVSNVFNRIKSAITSILNTIKTVVSTVWNGIKTVISTVVNAVYSVVSNIFNRIKSVVTTISDGIKTVVSNAWNGIKNVISTIGGTIGTVVSNVFNGVSSTISGIMDGIKGLIKGAFDKITGIFNTVLKPNIKMPHLNISGKFSLNPPSVPKFGIDWYETGGIFTGASVIGVGENGDEAVLPLSNKRRMKPFASAVASMMDTITPNTSNEASGGINITISQMVVREETDIKKIAEELNKLTMRGNRKKGLV